MCKPLPTLIGLLLTLVISSTSFAQEVAVLSCSGNFSFPVYDLETLKDFEPLVSQHIEYIYDDFIAHQLFSDQLTALEDVQFRFPLTSEINRGYPFSYYVAFNPPTVTLPIISLKFLDDMTIAYAWLNINGYTTQSVTDYITILKYRSDIAQELPPPLDALHIPANALDDPEVNDLASKLFNEALVFIVAHELGHIVFGHEGTIHIAPEQSRINEQQADEFALEMLRSIPIIPVRVGIVLFWEFHCIPNMNDFSTVEWEQYVAHMAYPLTLDRIEVIWRYVELHSDGFIRQAFNQAAARKDLNAFLGYISELRQFLGDPELQETIIIRAAGLDLGILEPRLISGLYCPESENSPNQGIFEGVYAVVWTTTTHLPETGEIIEFPVCVTFQRFGDRVSGDFEFGLGIGSIYEGYLSDNVLEFEWSWAENSGNAILTINDDGSEFTGTISGTILDSEYGDLGTWAGSR